jgi:hypothetical protein
MPASSTATRPRQERFRSLTWWMRDRDGKVVLAQPPNPAIILWLVSVVVGWTDLLDEHRDAVLTRIGQGALVAWSLDELLRGASPIRRVLGLVVLAGLLVRLFG